MGCHDRLIVPKFSNEEIAAVVAGGRLLTMEIEFNSNCNFSCIYCYIEKKNKPENELTREELRDAIVQAKSLGVIAMVVLGGEPMLYPHLMEMLRFIREKGMDVELFTNGSNMTEHAARELFEIGATVVLKTNSFDEKTQDMLAGRAGAHRQIQNAFGNLKLAGYPGKGRSLCVSTVISGHNYEELEKLWRWLREQSIIPYFEIITPQGKAKEYHSLYVDPPRLRDIFYRLSEIDKEYGFNWDPQPPLAGMECLRHQYSLVLKSTGQVYPCVGVNIPVGNVRETKLADIIKSSDVLNKLRNYKKNLKGPCRECDKFGRCYGCRGAAYQLTGDYLASDPLCWRHNGDLHENVSLPAEVIDIVPHKPPMLMVDRLVEVGKQTVVETEVKKEMVFVNETGRLDEIAFVEMVAQTMAAHEGFQNADGGNYREGFLIGVKNFKIYKAASMGDVLKIIIERITQYGEFAVINGQIFNNGNKLAEGEIKIFQNKGIAKA